MSFLQVLTMIGFIVFGVCLFAIGVALIARFVKRKIDNKNYGG